jgi:hypothetical protein
VHAGNPHVRAEAFRFLADRAKVAYWDAFLGLDGALLRHAQRLVDGRER